MLSSLLLITGCSDSIVKEHKELQKELLDYATLYPAKDGGGSLFVDGFEIKNIAVFELSLDEIDDIGRDYVNCSEVYLDGFDTLIGSFYIGGILYLINNECALPSVKIEKIKGLSQRVKSYSPLSEATKPWNDLSKLYGSNLDKLYIPPPHGNGDPMFWTRDNVAVCVERSNNSKNSDVVFGKDENFSASIAQSCRQQLINYGKDTSSSQNKNKE